MSDALLLKRDPDLARGLYGPQRQAALAACRVRTALVRPGPWEPSGHSDGSRGYGLLVMSGALCRRLTHGDCLGAELLGRGDLLRPGDPLGEWSTLPVRSQWLVLKTSELAILDLSFTRRAGPFPEVSANLAGRALQRSANQATINWIIGLRRVDERIVMLFRHLAVRFGEARPDGVHVALPLTHRIIGEVIAVRRPTVTTALTQLQDQGVLRRDDEGWLLDETGPASRPTRPVARVDARPIPAGATPVGVSAH